MRTKTILKTALALGVVAGSILAEGVSIRSVNAQSVNAQSVNAQAIESDQPTSLEALQSTVIRRNDVTGDQPASLEALRSSGERMTTGAPSGATLPFPEELSAAIAMVTPMNGQLMISMENNTGAPVTYEVIGDTARRILEAGESVTLQGISLPSTITLVRQDEGLLDVEVDSIEEGMLSLFLTPESSLDDTQGVIRIQEDGQVFLN